MPKQKRRIFNLRWSIKLQHWILLEGKDLLGGFPTATKRIAEKDARSHCRRLYQYDNKPVQLRIHDKRGRIIEEASYGCDSRRRKG